MTGLLVEKFWMLLIICLFKSIVRDDAMAVETITSGRLLSSSGTDSSAMVTWLCTIVVKTNAWNVRSAV